MAVEQGTKLPVVLYPSPGIGHLVSMVELGNLLHRHGHSTILIVDPTYNGAASTAPFISSLSSSNPSLSFHRLPPSSNLDSLTFNHLRLSNPNLLLFLRSSPACALIVDFFFTSCALDVAAELRLPCYCFYTSAASALSGLLHLPTLLSLFPAGFKHLGASLIRIPGVPPIPADHMPLSMLDFGDDAYKPFLDIAVRMPEFQGIIINTFSKLEQRAVDAITARSSTPPIYCVGPLIRSEGVDQSGGVECISWLDSQPKRSVVFLCFGSLGLFSAEQIKEIATGLEHSGQRFLWVVRSPSPSPSPPSDDSDEILPEGFVERTRGKGMVVRSWAPQVEVLRNESVGGFVTHCGWNSVLEAICGGVPMIGWPLYAEQRWNKVFLVEEMKLAVEMRGFESGMVRAGEVEERIRWLMESEGGRELRERTVAAKEAAMTAAREGGSSHATVERLVRSWESRVAPES